MNTFKSIYGTKEIFAAIILLALFSLIDILFYIQIYLANDLSKDILFPLVVLNLTGIIILALPAMQHKIESKNPAALTDFLQLPVTTDKLTFPVITTFLGEQALGAFLVTATTFITKFIFQGVFLGSSILAGCFCVAATCITIVIISFSLIRFVMYFTKHSWPFYTIAGLTSLFIMLSFYALGLAM